MERRNFLKIGGIGIAALLAAPSLAIDNTEHNKVILNLDKSITLTDNVNVFEIYNTLKGEYKDDIPALLVDTPMSDSDYPLPTNLIIKPKTLVLNDGWCIEEDSFKYITWGLFKQKNDIYHRVNFGQDFNSTAIIVTDGELFEAGRLGENKFEFSFFVKNPTMIEIPLDDEGVNRYHPGISLDSEPTIIVVPMIASFTAPTAKKTTHERHLDKHGNIVDIRDMVIPEDMKVKLWGENFTYNEYNKLVGYFD